jgi:hypothetical protein
VVASLQRPCAPCSLRSLLLLVSAMGASDQSCLSCVRRAEAVGGRATTGSERAAQRADNSARGGREKGAAAAPGAPPMCALLHPFVCGVLRVCSLRPLLFCPGGSEASAKRKRAEASGGLARRRRHGSRKQTPQRRGHPVEHTGGKISASAPRARVSVRCGGLPCHAMWCVGGGHLSAPSLVAGVPSGGTGKLDPPGTG